MDRIHDFIYIEVELFREYLGASVAVDSKSYEQAVHVYHESRGLVPEGYKSFKTFNFIATFITSAVIQ
jgi:hypothetical protein